MKELDLIYKILKILQKGIPNEERDLSLLSHEALGITFPAWSRIMAMLVRDGYVTGVEVWNAMECDYPRVKLIRPEITMQGLLFLDENSTMRKIANATKGVIDVIT